jgi:DNA polymerase V
MSSSRSHGGVRAGAGRPSGSNRYGESTRAVRVPESLVPGLQQLLDDFSRLRKGSELSSIRPARAPFGPLPLPLYSSTVRAGFPSPADDFIEDHIDLNQQLVQHPEATFFVRVSGYSMRDAGILPGDVLVVDRSIEPRDGHVVIAVIDAELTVKRLHRRHGQVRLVAENPEFPDIVLRDEQELTIWGVVRHVIHSL